MQHSSQATDPAGCASSVTVTRKKLQRWRCGQVTLHSAVCTTLSSEGPSPCTALSTLTAFNPATVSDTHRYLSRSFVADPGRDLSIKTMHVWAQPSCPNITHTMRPVSMPWISDIRPIDCNHSEDHTLPQPNAPVNHSNHTHSHNQMHPSTIIPPLIDLTPALPASAAAVGWPAGCRRCG